MRKCTHTHKRGWWNMTWRAIWKREYWKKQRWQTGESRESAPKKWFMTHFHWCCVQQIAPRPLLGVASNIDWAKKYVYDSNFRFTCRIIHFRMQKRHFPPLWLPLVRKRCERPENIMNIVRRTDVCTYSGEDAGLVRIEPQNCCRGCNLGNGVANFWDRSRAKNASKQHSIDYGTIDFLSADKVQPPPVHSGNGAENRSKSLRSSIDTTRKKYLYWLVSICIVVAFCPRIRPDSIQILKRFAIGLPVRLLRLKYPANEMGKKSTDKGKNLIERLKTTKCTVRQ